GRPKAGPAPSGGSDPCSGGAWGHRASRRAAPRQAQAPSGGSDPRSGGAWGPATSSGGMGRLPGGDELVQLGGIAADLHLLTQCAVAQQFRDLGEDLEVLLR